MPFMKGIEGVIKKIEKFMRCSDMPKSQVDD